MKFPPCIARTTLTTGECCLHHKAGRFKEPVTPDICNACPHKGGVELSGPSPLQKLINVSKAAGQAAMNPTFASEEEQCRRREICNRCKFQVSKNTCSECGCNLKYKTKLETWQCDLGFWKEGAPDPPPKTV